MVGIDRCATIRAAGRQATVIPGLVVPPAVDENSVVHAPLTPEPCGALEPDQQCGAGGPGQVMRLLQARTSDSSRRGLPRGGRRRCRVHRRGRVMEKAVERCAGLDIHRDTVVANVRVPEEPAEGVTQTFGTTWPDLLAGLADGLSDQLDGDVRPARPSSCRCSGPGPTAGPRSGQRTPRAAPPARQVPQPRSERGQFLRPPLQVLRCHIGQHDQTTTSPISSHKI